MCHLQQLTCDWWGSTRRYNRESTSHRFTGPHVGAELMSKFLHAIFKTRQRAFSLIAVLLMGLASVSLSAWAADSISVSISVVDDKGQAVPLAETQIKAGGKVIAKANTDSSGKAVMSVESPGEYTLSVQKKDYLENESSIQLSAVQGSQQIDLVLSPASLSDQKIEVQATASSPVTEASASTSTLDTKQAAQTASKPAS